MNFKTGLLPNIENRWPLFMELLSPKFTLYGTLGEILSYGTKNSLIYNSPPPPPNLLEGFITKKIITST